MKKGYSKRLIGFVLSLSLIVASAIGVPMMNGYATGVSGNPNPSLFTRVCSLSGSSVQADAYTNGLGGSTTGYPRYLTNGNQLRTIVSAYDSAGIKSLVIRFIKNNETDPARTWGPYGNVTEIYNQTFSPYNNYEDKYNYFTLTPGRYILMVMATATDGRSSMKFDYIEYGKGNIIVTDCDTAYRKTTNGWWHCCAIYDLTGKGIDIPQCTLAMANVNTYATYYANYLNITLDPYNGYRYVVNGTVNPTTSGTYRTWIRTMRSTGSYETYSFPRYTYN